MNANYFPEKKIQQFGNKLIKWYHQHKRDLPWRNTHNPYHILLSEVILQQTRVNQGMPYYQQFIDNYPTISDLANASEGEVLRVWQGLGYYSRGRNLHATAKQIVELFGAKVPETFQELIKLKGIGTYTASAIASFAFQEPKAVVDGNVYRVLSRYWGIEEDISSGKGKKKFQEIATSLLPKIDSHIYNQAIMEFGALQCTPKNPDCECCIFQDTCFAKRNNLQNVLPVKSKKVKKINRSLFYLLFIADKKLGLTIRQQNDIWKGLYEFYSVNIFEETSFEININSLLTRLKIEPIAISFSKPIKHILTHQNLTVHIAMVNIKLGSEKIIEQQLGIKFYKASEADNLPKPILLSKFLENNNFC